ncbi:MAG: hypothetical protein AB7F22_05385 [Reyranella sp.]|uniref:hypothetical protein n=1 Tax=Reyranella sp. TaxID=1929291 RepID=UPI003D0E7F9D
MINFPSAPVVGDTYTYGSRTWVWNGSGWERQINAGQIVSVFVTPGTEVIETTEPLPAPIGADWYELNYV